MSIKRSPINTGDLRRSLSEGVTTVGTFVGMDSDMATEVCANAGADWVLIDMEHGGGGEEQIRRGVVSAAAYGVPVIVRVESSERIRVGRALDLGAWGVMYPRIETPDEAARLVQHLHYPPLGDRGAATYNRQSGFGLHPESLKHMNERVVGIVQVETLGAVNSLDDIAATHGVDVLFVGPVDLSYALGCPMDFANQKFQTALDQVVAAADRAGITAGILASDANKAAAYRARGFRFLAIGSDSLFLGAALKEAFSQVKGAAVSEESPNQHEPRIDVRPL